METPIEQRARRAFPALLKEITDPPKVLYLRGSLPSDDLKFLCVVGSRKYTPYGKSTCEKLIAGLSGYPVVIVSGLALGIDSIAHEAALGARIRTIAIPGSGLDDRVLYPRAHVGLAKRILDAEGALLSEFPPQHSPRPENFPQRNRIMAGVSHAVLVIEAEERSGTLITARLATDYNRDVLTVPGPLSSTTSAGPHLLIRNGATLIRSSEDILEALDIAAETGKTDQSIELSDRERVVFDLLRAPCSRDELIAELDLPVHEANVLLATMELKALIVEELGVIRVR